MTTFRVGEKDRDGRQKRIDYSGRYLRASRTGGVALRAHVKAAGINLTGNTSHGFRLSTRLAKNTQVAMQNGRFVLRGRYGPDIAKVNLSKSGVSVSSKVGLGTINWMRPGASSAKFAGVQFRGQKAAAANGIYLALMGLASLTGAFFRLAGWSVRLLAGALQWAVGRWQQARQARERIAVDTDTAAAAGEDVLGAHAIVPSAEPVRDLFAALVYLTAVMGRGDRALDAAIVDAHVPDNPFTAVLVTDVNAAGGVLENVLADHPAAEDPAAILGVIHHLAGAFAARVDEATRTEAVFAIDDACLALGPRTILQDALLDRLVESLGVELQLIGERE